MPHAETEEFIYFIVRNSSWSTLQLQMIVTKNPSDAIVAAGVASGVRQKIDSQVIRVELWVISGRKHERMLCLLFYVELHNIKRLLNN